MIMAESKEHFLESLLEEIRSRAGDNEAEQLCEYAQQFYRRISLEDLEHRAISDITGGLLGCWRYLRSFTPENAKVRVFNPDFERHGWQSSSTMVGIISEHMPFIIDSVRMEISRRNIAIHTIHHAVLHVVRDQHGNLIRLLGDGEDTSAAGVNEEVQFYLEITRTTDEEILADIRLNIEAILQEVSLVVSDHQPMLQKARDILAELPDISAGANEAQLAETSRFLAWMTQNNFTFLGFEELSVDYPSSSPAIAQLAGTTLGLLKKYESSGQNDLLSGLAKPPTKKLQPFESQLKFSKSGQRSRVHRLAYPDYIEIVKFDADGVICGAYRFLGLFTSAVYSAPPMSIPIVRLKIREILEHTGLKEGHYGARDLLRVIEILPRDELFHSATEQLFHTCIAIYQIQERPKIRLFVRRDLHGQFYSCLVYVPRDIYRTELRLRIQRILEHALGAIESEFTTLFSESILTRTHFMLRVDRDNEPEFDVKVLEQEIKEAAQQWQDMLSEALVDEFGEEQGYKDANAYRDGFPPGYRDDFDPRAAVSDIKNFKRVEQEGKLQVLFHRVLGEQDEQLRFRLFSPDNPLALSDVIPILENMGMRVLGEHPYGIHRQDGKQFWIHDFSLVYAFPSSAKLSTIQPKFQQAFLRIWDGLAESDAFNRLIAGAGLNWRDTALLRAYAHYMKQIRYSFSDQYIAATLGNHLAITQLIVKLFNGRFMPDHGDTGALEAAIEADIIKLLDDVENLNEDTIIRYYVALIKATSRTNYFQTQADGTPKDYFSFKLIPGEIPELPLPKPAYEIFVYSPDVEGVHLRGGKVARGGLRWSDRQEDFRTEILGLVKAQQVKNAVIVPVGAKGGFIAKKLQANWSREQTQQEGIASYKTFIRGLLDITDNLVEGEISAPEKVTIHDQQDPYLVVAADKGTASFSDIANALSKEYNFWLGDAFASGGSIGYDHKKMGITAKGAWVSVQRHFRERGIDVQQQDFTVVGIGDMAGDVFGNGMLLSEHICLVAAFNHQHIFIDPNPVAAASFEERKRLFALPRSNWTDYDNTLISEGGGIFSRSAKSIALSPQIRQRFNLNVDHMQPNALISALLKAPVDLLWNGGIGTYVKGRSETDPDVGDKSNDPVRINGSDMRCQVVGEGGNLGFTQLGRTEFSLGGGAINTDFIDNSAGVDCSDHEVNIKILLNEKIAQGDLTEKQRVALLEDMTDEVSSLVLKNNYLQVQALSIAETESLHRTEEYRRLLNSLASDGRLSRELEYLPDDETLMERKTHDKGLSRPELSVLLAYVKGQVKEQILDSGIPENDYLAKSVSGAFPSALHDRFANDINRHRLQREIVATQLANDLVNRMGPTYMERMLHSTNANADNIVTAYIAARDIFNMPYYWQQIEALDNQINTGVQIEMMLEIIRLTRQASRWLLQNRRTLIDPGFEVTFFQQGVNEICEAASQLLDGKMIVASQEKFDHYRDAGVNESLAGYMACSNNLISCLGVVEAAHKRNIPVLEVARVNFELGDRLQLHWFARQITNLKVENDWQAMARESFLDEMEWQLRAIVASTLQFVDTTNCASDGVHAWLEHQTAPVARWDSLITDLRNTESKEFAMYSVAIRGLLDLAQADSLP